MENNQKSSSPLYVKVYSQILSMIKEGDFEAGSRLPAENALAKQFGVSRSTLRQALLLLQEDGIIFNYKGKGNFVTNSQTNMETGIERVTNVAITFIKEGNVETETHISYQMPSKLLQEKLKINESNLLVFIECLYHIKEENVSLTNFFIPYDKLSKYNLNLNDENLVANFINEYIDNHITSIQTNLKFMRVQESEWYDKLKIELNEPIIIFDEIMLSDLGEHVIYAKTYLKPEYYNFNLLRH